MRICLYPIHISSGIDYQRMAIAADHNPKLSWNAKIFLGPTQSNDFAKLRKA